jgi:hypothetical protein
MKFPAWLGLLVLLSACGTASDPTAAPPTLDEKVVCSDEVVTGSRFTTTRCRRVYSIEQERRGAQEAVRALTPGVGNER